MKSKYLNKIILTSGLLLTPVLSMELHKNNFTVNHSETSELQKLLPERIPYFYKQYQQTSKEPITEKESSRVDLLCALNDALNLGEITSENQEQALSIAKAVNGTNLIVRLNNYQHEDKTKNFFYLFPELRCLIITYLSSEIKVKELLGQGLRMKNFIDSLNKMIERHGIFTHQGFKRLGGFLFSFC